MGRAEGQGRAGWGRERRVGWDGGGGGMVGAWEAERGIQGHGQVAACEASSRGGRRKGCVRGERHGEGQAKAQGRGQQWLCSTGN